MSLPALFGNQCKRELLLHLRQPRLLLHASLFFLMITVFFPLTLPAEKTLLRAVVPGLVWIAMLLSMLLSSASLFQQDYEDGVIEQLMISAYPLSLIIAAKLLGVSHFFGQSTLYIALLLVSGFTGAIAWISLCWAQINFRKRLYKAGYTTDDLSYKTPGSPYTGIIAICLMVLCLIFLALNQDPAYKIAFLMGLISLTVPMIVYKCGGFSKTRAAAKELNKHLHFKDIFPDRNPK